MNCPNCGAYLDNNGGFCRYCGWRVPAAAPAYQPAPPEGNPYGAYAQPALRLPLPYSFFDGSALGLFGVNLLTGFLMLITLGFAFPWLWCYKRRWVYEHTCINGYRLYFNGRGIQLIGKWLLWMFLTLITLTIFGWFIPTRLMKWEIKHVSINSVVVNPPR